MPDTPITSDCTECGLPNYAAQEARNQRVVLDFLLEQHPAQLTIPEVSDRGGWFSGKGCFMYRNMKQ